MLIVFFANRRGLQGTTNYYHGANKAPPSFLIFTSGTNKHLSPRLSVRLILQALEIPPLSYSKMKASISNVASQRLQRLRSVSRHTNSSAILVPYNHTIKAVSARGFSFGACLCVESRALGQSSNHGKQGTTTPKSHDFDDAVGQSKEKQIRTPWHREGSSTPPVSRRRLAGAMVKGDTDRYSQ